MQKTTGTGATVVILSHTNKHTDKDGKPVFEGTKMFVILLPKCSI